MSRKILGNSPLAAFLASAAAAGACYVFLTYLQVILDGGFESATSNSIYTKIVHLAFMIVISFIIGSGFAIVTAFLPFLLGWKIAVKFKIRSVVFFVAGSILTSILLSPIYWLVFPQMMFYSPADDLSLSQKAVSVMPSFAFSGLIAGIVCWSVVRSNPLLKKQSEECNLA